MTNKEKIYYMFQDGECKHWFRDNADMLQLAEYLDKKGCVVLNDTTNHEKTLKDLHEYVFCSQPMWKSMGYNFTERFFIDIESLLCTPKERGGGK